MAGIKQLTFTVEDMKHSAVEYMESCITYLTVGDVDFAARDYGKAQVWAEMLDDIGIVLEDEDEHFRAMMATADERLF